MKSIKDMNAVITGGGSGIGRELAIQLSLMGAIPIITDIDKKGLNETCKIIQKNGGVCHPYLCDVSDRKKVYQFADKAIKEHKHIDFLINNAGRSMHGWIEDLTYESFELIMAINFWGTVYCTKAFLPHLRTRPAAHIVNMSSVYGIMSIPSKSVYSITKFAVRAFTEALRQELHGTAIKVSCVHPGGVRTNNIKNRLWDLKKGEKRNIEKEIKRFHTASRTSAEEAAAVIIKGMLKNKPRILVGADAKIISLVARLMPARYDWFSRGIVFPKIK
jgi:short-subunit dehydrogenase